MPAHTLPCHVFKVAARRQSFGADEVDVDHAAQDEAYDHEQEAHRHIWQSLAADLCLIPFFPRIVQARTACPLHSPLRQSTSLTTAGSATHTRCVPPIKMPTGLLQVEHTAHQLITSGTTLTAANARAYLW